MFDIGMFELILIGVIALLILGPERMPEAARSAGRWVGKARRFITGIKEDVSSQMSLDELNELRQLRNDLTAAKTELGKLQNSAENKLNRSFSTSATDTEKPQQPKLSNTEEVEDKSSGKV
jgi:sec-independent protein translocase protein TatB